MQYSDRLIAIFVVMFRMGKRGFTGTRETEYRCHIFSSIWKSVLFLSAVAGCVTIAVRDRPRHRQCTFLMLTKIFHAKDSGTVFVCIEIAESLIIAQAAIVHIWTWCRLPLRI